MTGCGGALGGDYGGVLLLLMIVFCRGGVRVFAAEEAGAYSFADTFEKGFVGDVSTPIGEAAGALEVECLIIGLCGSFPDLGGVGAEGEPETDDVGSD